MAATRKAAAEKAGSNTERYGETKRRFKALEALDALGDGDEEECGAICRLHGEAMEDGEKWLLGEE